MQLTSDELFQLYQDGQNYNMDILTIDGPIRYVGPDMYGLPCIELGDTHNGHTRITCVFHDADLSDIPDHGHATITGECQGFAYGMVIIKKAQIIDIIAD